MLVKMNSAYAFELTSRSRYLQALNDAQSAEAKVPSKNREEPVKERRWPADLGHDENNDLSDDQQSVEDRPEGTGRLVRHGGSTFNVC